LRSQRTGCQECHENIYLERDQLSGKTGQDIEPAFRRSDFECQILILDKAGFGQAFAHLRLEGIGVRGAQQEHADTVHLSLLCARSSWKRRCRATQQRNKIASVHRFPQR
jgi:hypothetical protein